MKYTLIRPDTDQVLWTGDLDAKGNVVRGHFIEVKVQGSEGPHVTFLAHGPHSDGTYSIATAFGSMKVALIRGASPETVGGNASKQKILKSSMPGKVMKILCHVGDSVTKDQPLLIIEAMKMENEIRSPISGTVAELGVAVGQKVETGELLAKIEAQ